MSFFPLPKSGRVLPQAGEIEEWKDERVKEKKGGEKKWVGSNCVQPAARTVIVLSSRSFHLTVDTVRQLFPS